MKFENRHTAKRVIEINKEETNAPFAICNTTKFSS